MEHLFTLGYRLGIIVMIWLVGQRVELAISLLTEMGAN